MDEVGSPFESGRCATTTRKGTAMPEFQTTLIEQGSMSEAELLDQHFATTVIPVKQYRPLLELITEDLDSHELFGDDTCDRECSRKINPGVVWSVIMSDAEPPVKEKDEHWKRGFELPGHGQCPCGCGATPDNVRAPEPEDAAREESQAAYESRLGIGAPPRADGLDPTQLVANALFPRRWVAISTEADAVAQRIYDVARGDECQCNNCNAAATRGVPRFRMPSPPVRMPRIYDDGPTVDPMLDPRWM